MRPNLAQLMHEIEARKIFKRKRKDVRLKIPDYYISLVFLLEKLASSYQFSRK